MLIKFQAKNMVQFSSQYLTFTSNVWNLKSDFWQLTSGIFFIFNRKCYQAMKSELFFKTGFFSELLQYIDTLLSRGFGGNIIYWPRPEYVLEKSKAKTFLVHTLVDIYQGIGSFSVWRFGLYSPNHLCYRKYILISIKALICGYFEPKKLRARPQNKAATPL